MGASIDTVSGTPAYLRAIDQSTGIFSGGLSYPFSASCWIKRADSFELDIAHLGFNRGNTNGNVHALTTERGSNVANAAGGILTNNGSTSGSASTPDVLDDDVDNVWVLVLGVWASSTSRVVYFLDENTSSSNATDITPTQIDSLTIGAQREFASDVGVFDIAEIGIWDIALSQADVANLKTQKPNAVQVANLVHYWPLLDDLGDDAGSITLEDVNENVTVSAANHPFAAGGDSSSPMPIFEIYYRHLLAGGM